MSTEPVVMHTRPLRMDSIYRCATEQMRDAVAAALAAESVEVERHVSFGADGVEARLPVGVTVLFRIGWGSSPYQCEACDFHGHLRFTGTPCRTPEASVRQAMVAIRKWARAERARLDVYARDLQRKVGIKSRAKQPAAPTEAGEAGR